MKVKHLALAVALALGASNAVMAQETSSALRGVVTTEAGTSVANATIVLTDKRNGISRTLTTNNTGTFSARGLQVGGPYMLVVTVPEGRTETVDNVFLTLGYSKPECSSKSCKRRTYRGNWSSHYQPGLW